MLPSDHRLDAVAARLVARFEGTRRSHPEPKSAKSAFEEVIEVEVRAVAAELRELGLHPDPEGHAAFLRRELAATFLPRYLALAARRNPEDHEAEARLSTLYRAVLLGGLALAAVISLRFGPRLLPIEALAALALLAGPFVDAWRRSRHELAANALIEDLARIQAHQDGLPGVAALDGGAPIPNLRARDATASPRPTQETR